MSPAKMSPSTLRKSSTRFILVILSTVTLLILPLKPFRTAVYAGDNEFVGSLDGQLLPNTDDLDQIIFRPLRDLSKVKFATPIAEGATITAGRLYDPLRDKSAILTLLVIS